jgi:hypothetical protein
MLNPKAAREGIMTYTQQPAEPPSFLVAVTLSAVWPTTSSSLAATGMIQGGAVANGAEHHYSA